MSTFANELARIVDALPTLEIPLMICPAAQQKYCSEHGRCLRRQGDVYVAEEWIVMALMQDEQVGEVWVEGLAEKNINEFIESQRQGRTVEGKNDEETRNALENLLKISPRCAPGQARPGHRP